MENKSKKQRILELLMSKEYCTQAELNDIAFRYGARIHELKREGHNIRTRQIKKGQFVFEYVHSYKTDLDSVKTIHEIANRIADSKEPNLKLNL